MTGKLNKNYMTEIGEKKQPVNTIQGWGLMAHFVDDDLNVFKKGKFIGSIEEAKATGEEFDPTPSASRLGKTSKTVDDELSLARKALDQNQKLFELMQKMIEKQDNSGEAKELARTLLEFQAASTGQPMRYGVAKTDPDDILEKKDAVTYYSPSWLFLVYDYHDAAGVPLKNPHNKPIVFKCQGSVRVKDQNEERMRAFCTYSTRSKSEIKWLEEHPMFDLMFFRKSNKAINTNSMIVTRSAEIYKRILEWDKARILDEARNEGLDFDPAEGLEPLCKKLAQIKVVQAIEEDLKQQHAKQADVLVNNMIQSK